MAGFAEAAGAGTEVDVARVADTILSRVNSQYNAQKSEAPKSSVLVK